MRIHVKVALLLVLDFFFAQGFLQTKNGALRAPVSLPATSVGEKSLPVDPSASTKPKARLMGLLQKTLVDPVLADPDTKEPVQISVVGTLVGGQQSATISKYRISSSSNQYAGSTDSYINLLEPTVEKGRQKSDLQTALLRQTLPLVPVGLRKPLASVVNKIKGDTNNEIEVDDYVPMRDLFTSPAVSFAYERGWRQNFATAGFPGPDKEAEMAMEYFAAPVARAGPSSVVVDMSCATGLFTRRFAASKKYGRVIGCDYSDSMLREARRRIVADRSLRGGENPVQLDLVRLDVGKIPMQNETVDALHAGAAMHCWPELDKAASEIYRVLKPGGRYFATTFLQRYFRSLEGQSSSNAGIGAPSTEAFHYFQSVETLRDLMVRGGFDASKISIEVLGTACVVIRCEK